MTTRNKIFASVFGALTLLWVFFLIVDIKNDQAGWVIVIDVVFIIFNSLLTAAYALDRRYRY